MSIFLLKSEPSVYSLADLQRDKKIPWDGVTNNTALIHIRSMKKGDTAIIYHTGDQRAAVGLAKITTNPYPDPKAGNPKIVIVDIAYDRAFKSPVTLDQIKSDKRFAAWDLLRISRLSVVPTTESQLAALLQLADG